ncbi:TonB-dependent receptor plug domain-containing protein [Frigoriflavimonas asaccharolytica]|uniref:Outer membrane receptor protein involved in Fe transport n=1 Tax=Frigoriflavimonas asaccharolytica TaxID=2735899 RepID=A0A8J8K900_9FLAO|nr:TonB-dependent receptor plug domain-containing protein [Frigoriflavimonas asaccharolytica]NRS93091.1 outer membrane receptor protein involved in Fe transport [Frigoriflavimonas asaccharolytica]
MKLRKLSIGVLFLFGATTVVFAQNTQKDTIRKEQNVEGVLIQGSRNKSTETAILLDQKKAIIQKQSIGSEEISRKGISNLEQGLTKITGINTVESRGLFVRGLEERYNNLLLNGLATPSNNPFQKIIALNQFPTDIVSKLDIYKTYQPDLFGDFAGATFDIQTLVPEKDITKIEFSVGVNTLSSFRNNFKINENAYTMEGYVGLNSEDRQLPAEIKGFRPSSTTIPFSSFQDTWNVNSVKSLPNTAIGLTVARTFRAENNDKFGFLFNLNQSSEYQYREGNDNLFDNGGQYKNKLRKTEYNYNLQSNALLGLNFKNKSTKVDIIGSFLQNSENQIQDNLGFKDNLQDNIQFFRTNQQDISRLTDIQVLVSQKIGERQLLKAGGSWVNNYFSQPDRKTIYGVPNGDNTILFSYGGNNFIRQYLDLKGDNYFSGNAEYQLSLGKKNEDDNYYPITVKAGYNGFADKRDMSYRFVFSRTQNSSPYTLNIDQPDALLQQQNNAGLFTFQESDQPNYKNFLYQFVNAGYTSINYKPDNSWDVLAGLRAENDMSIIRYKSISDDINGSFRNIEKNRTYFLPSLAVKKSLNSKLNLRFAGSKTITRPILIETLPIEYISPDNNNIVGNPNIDNSQNYNVDLKIEYFPKNNELIALNIFGKKIDKAIERSYIASGNSTGTVITFFNAKSATLFGAEAEVNVGLDRISESLSNFSLGANATVLYSDVERSIDQINETNFNDKRTLQGAAPWIVNADLKYEFKNASRLKSTASLVYNVSGKKIYGVGFGNLDNVIELPFHQLDLVLQTEISKNVTAKLGILNILDSTYRLELGENSKVDILSNTLLMEDYKRGTSFNFSVAYTF